MIKTVHEMAYTNSSSDINKLYAIPRQVIENTEYGKLYTIKFLHPKSAFRAMLKKNRLKSQIYFLHEDM